MGRATALALAETGAAVAIGDRQDAEGAALVAEIETSGGTACYFPVDVAAPADVAQFIQRIVDRFGRIDVAVNNAGIEGLKSRIGDYPDDEWAKVIDINLSGVFYCMKHEINAMISGGSGSIVNVGSTASLRGTASMGAYTAAKHGIIGLTKSAALEYADRNIRVNAICPGSFRTPMSERLNNGDFSKIERATPMNRIASAAEIARAIVWLCLDESSFVTGAALPVDGGKLAGSPL